nr:DUF2312 domain-containing protein [Oceanicella actignis]
MKKDPDFEAAANVAFRATGAELRQFIERLEQIEAERRDLVDRRREVMDEAKARGYDAKAIRQIVKERGRSREELAEEQAVLQLYRDALGM